MIIRNFTAGILGANNYLLFDERFKGAVLIDCSAQTDFVEEELKKNNAELKYILLTHGHFDHVMGINDTKKLHPKVKVLAHIGDKDLIEGIQEFMQKYGMGEAEVPQIDEYIQEGEICNGKIKILHTPGHTKGSVCYLIDDNLFSGDTIFLGSVGRTDLPGGSYEQLKKSVQNLLTTLGEDVNIYAGHGDFTTVKYEKLYNPMM